MIDPIDPTLNPPHNEGSPASVENFMRLWKSMDPETCPCAHCGMPPTLSRMSGDAWAVMSHHSRACPEHEDNQPAHEIHFGLNPGVAEVNAFLDAEHIWSARRTRGDA